MPHWQAKTWTESEQPMLMLVDPTRVARRLRVRGVVQGVVFGPLYRFATHLGLAGWVRNDGGGVEIEIHGSEPVLDAFTQCLATEAPPLPGWM
jgi:hydrogenase maturation protein HypF